MYLILGIGFVLLTDSCSAQDISRLTFSIGLLLVIQILVNLLLIVGSLRRLPSLFLPWLGVQAGNLGLALVCLVGVLMFGQTHLSLSLYQYSLTLAMLGTYCCLALPACVVVVRTRADMMLSVADKDEKTPPSYYE